MKRLGCPRCESRKQHREVIGHRAQYTCTECGFVWINGTTGGKFRGPDAKPVPERIVEAFVGPYPKQLLDPMPSVYVTTDCGRRLRLFSFYPDEIDFTPADFVGKTLSEAHRLHHERDVAYLRGE